MGWDGYHLCNIYILNMSQMLLKELFTNEPLCPKDRYCSGCMNGYDTGEHFLEMCSELYPNFDQEKDNWKCYVNYAIECMMKNLTTEDEKKMIMEFCKTSGLTFKEGFGIAHGWGDE